jgi:hypothetical protein
MMGFIRKTLASASLVFTHPSVLALAGAGLVSYGAYLIYHPAGFVTGGLLLLLASWDAGRD